MGGGRRSSSSKAQSCPAWRRWPTSRHGPCSPPLPSPASAHSGELEDVQDERLKGAAFVERTGPAAGGTLWTTGTSSSRPPFAGLCRGRADGSAWHRASVDRGAGRLLGRRGRVHRRDIAGHARRNCARRLPSAATPSGASSSARPTRAFRKKIHAALHHGLLPIMCVGETETEREAGETEEVIARQLARGLVLLQTEDAGRLAIAYEPIWAIGTGKTATPEMAQEACAFIRRRLIDGAGDTAAQVVRILYGGSVRPDNIDELMAQPDIDGVLVGGASLNVGSFARIAGFVVGGERRARPAERPPSPGGLGHPRRLGIGAARAGQRHLSREDPRVGRPRGEVPAHTARRQRRGRGPAARHHGQLGSGPPDHRLRSGHLSGSLPDQPGHRRRDVLHEPRPQRAGGGARRSAAGRCT